MPVSFPGSSCRPCTVPNNQICPLKLSDLCVFYSGGNLTGSNIHTGDNLDVVINKLNTFISNISVSGSPAGTNNDIQFNENGVFTADSGTFTYNPVDGSFFSPTLQSSTAGLTWGDAAGSVFNASPSVLHYNNLTDSFTIGGNLQYSDGSGNSIGYSSGILQFIGQQVITGTSTVTTSFVPIYLDIKPTVTLSSGVYAPSGVIFEPTVTVTGGSAFLVGFKFAPVTTSVPDDNMTAFVNTAGNNTFNTVSGRSSFGTGGFTGTSVLQVFGNVYLRDRIGIGTGGITPTAQLHLGLGGSTAAGSAPIKITSGPLMTAVEVGAFEFDGTNLYFTPSAGNRKIVTLT